MQLCSNLDFLCIPFFSESLERRAATLSCHLLIVPGGSFHSRKLSWANSPKGMSQFSPLLSVHMVYLWEWVFNLSGAGKVFSALLQLCIYFRVLYKYSSKSLYLKEKVEHVLQEVTQGPDRRAAAIHSPAHPPSRESGGCCTWAAKLLLRQALLNCFNVFLLLHFHHSLKWQTFPWECLQECIKHVAKAIGPLSSSLTEG